MRYAGLIGVKLPPEEVSPGVWHPRVKTIKVRGKIYALKVSWSSGTLQQETPRATHKLTFIGTAELLSDSLLPLWVEWQGTKWEVISVDYQRPRIELRIGGVYNG